jgi:hypothetical protein
MKILKLLGYLSLSLGFVLLLIGVFSQLLSWNLFSVQHNISIIHTANGFILLAVALFVVTKKCCENCCDKK